MLQSNKKVAECRIFHHKNSHCSTRPITNNNSRRIFFSPGIKTRMNRGPHTHKKLLESTQKRLNRSNVPYGGLLWYLYTSNTMQLNTNNNEIKTSGICLMNKAWNYKISPCFFPLVYILSLSGEQLGDTYTNILSRLCVCYNALKYFIIPFSCGRSRRP